MPMPAALQALFDNPALKLHTAADLPAAAPGRKTAPHRGAAPINNAAEGGHGDTAGAAGRQAEHEAAAAFRETAGKTAGGVHEVETLLARRQQSLQRLLSVGVLHEWFLQTGQEIKPGAAADGPGGSLWFAPLTLLSVSGDLARQRSGRPYLFFIGELCRPGLQLLRGVLGDDLDKCIFVNAAADADRFWAIDQTLRCPATAAVIADASGCPTVDSRRWLLAAESAGVQGLLARPPWEQHQSSSAVVRWLVRPSLSNTGLPRWRITATRCKVAMHHDDPGPTWVVQWSYGQPQGTENLRNMTPNFNRLSLDGNGSECPADLGHLAVCADDAIAAPHSDNAQSPPRTARRSV